MPQPRGLAAPVELEAEQPERDLRLAVGAHAVVGALPVQVVPVDARPGRAATLTCEVTRARPARSRGSRWATRAKWPRWLVPNCSSNPSAVVCRSGGVMTPALLIRMWIGRPSLAQRRRRGRRRRRARTGRARAARRRRRGAAARIARDRGLALAGVADGQDHLGAGGGEPGGDAEADAVAGAGDDGALAGQVGDGDVDAVCVAWCCSSVVVWSHRGRACAADDPRPRDPRPTRAPRKGGSTGRGCGAVPAVEHEQRRRDGGDA